ncbi:MAG: hypothetical protein ACLGHM_03240 [Actinomycetes bacterium]|jgi:hypothetical protein
MRTQTSQFLAALILASGLATGVAACGDAAGDPRDAREPDAVGTVVSVETLGDAISVAFAPDPGYEYFEGTTFAFAEGGALERPDGEPAAASDVAVGERLEVWVDACAESFPVQCADPYGRLLP